MVLNSSLIEERHILWRQLSAEGAHPNSSTPITPPPKWWTAERCNHFHAEDILKHRCPKQGLILLGIFSIASDVQRRDLIRSTMLPQLPGELSRVLTHRFVVAILEIPDAASTAVAREHAARKDLIQLHETREHGRHGKSFDFFLFVARHWPWDFQWVIKADSDSYIVLPNLIRDVALLRSSDDGYLGSHCLPLRSQFNRSAYKEGFQTFVDDGASKYPQWMMCGMMYGLSSDLMRWLASPESLLARWQIHGHVPHGEDIQMRYFLHRKQRGSNAYSIGWSHCAELPVEGPLNKDSWHDETVLVHLIKQTEQWRAVHSRFSKARGRIQQRVLTELLDVDSSMTNPKQREHGIMRERRLASAQPWGMHLYVRFPNSSNESVPHARVY